MVAGRAGGRVHDVPALRGEGGFQPGDFLMEVADRAFHQVAHAGMRLALSQTGDGNIRMRRQEDAVKVPPRGVKPFILAHAGIGVKEIVHSHKEPCLVVAQSHVGGGLAREFQLLNQFFAPDRSRVHHPAVDHGAQVVHRDVKSFRGALREQAGKGAFPGGGRPGDQIDGRHVGSVFGFKMSYYSREKQTKTVLP